MQTDEMLQRLQPLIPRQVSQWKRALEHSDAETRRLIENQIRATARKKFGAKMDEQILLSLPPKKIALAPIELGTVIYSKERWPFGISTNELMQNLAIFGRSGAGKTNVVFQLLLQLKKKRIPFLFLDWKKTARHMLPFLARSTRIYAPSSNLSPLPFNPLIPPPGNDQSSYILQVVDVLASAYTLGDGAKHILQNAIKRCFDKKRQPSLSDVKIKIEHIETKDRKTGWKLTALRAIESLTFGQSQIDAKAQIAFARSLLTQNTILELDGLSANAKKFLIPLLCSWILAVRMHDSTREQLKFVIVFEEAHHVLYRQPYKNQESLMNQLLRQCRELGIACIVVDQQPHLISSAALANCYASICLNLKVPSDISKAAGLSLIPDSSKTCFSRLPIGTGIVKLQDRWHDPVLVKFPLISIRKGSVTDELMRLYITGNLTLSKLRERCNSAAPDSALNRERVVGFFDDNAYSRFSDAIESGAILLLEDVIAFPEDGVDARYQRLHMSRDRGNKLKQALIAQKLALQERRKTGRTYRVLLRPTDFARSLLAAGKGTDPHASFVHEYWKRKIAAKLKRDGYKVEIESPRAKSTGCMDIRAEKQNSSIAVEVETGKSNVVSNVKRNLLEGIDQVLVFATSEVSLRIVEKMLAKSGLILPARIRLFSAEDFQTGNFTDHAPMT